MERNLDVRQALAKSLLRLYEEKLGTNYTVNAKESDSTIGYEAASHFPPRGKALTDSRLATLCADAAWQAFLSYADRFLRLDSLGAYADAAERLGLYGLVLDELVAAIHRLIGHRLEKSRCGLPARQSIHR